MHQGDKIENNIDGGGIPWKITPIVAFNVLGLVAPITKSHQTNAKIIRRLWQKLNRRLHEVKNRPQNSDEWQKWGIAFRKKGYLFYCAGIPCAREMTVPDGFEIIHVDSFEYARFDHVGPLFRLKTTLNYIFKKGVLSIPYKTFIKHPSGLVYLERYDNRFHWNGDNSVVEILVPIVKK